MKTRSRLMLFVASLVLLATSFVLTLPREAEAACCGWTITERYYFDAALTQYAGRCIDNWCTGSYTCTGTQTEYFTISRSCCELCQA